MRLFSNIFSCLCFQILLLLLFVCLCVPTARPVSLTLPSRPTVVQQSSASLKKNSPLPSSVPVRNYSPTPSLRYGCVDEYSDHRSKRGSNWQTIQQHNEPFTLKTTTTIEQESESECTFRLFNHNIKFKKKFNFKNPNWFSSWKKKSVTFLSHLPQHGHRRSSVYRLSVN